MNDKKIRKLVFTALLAALTCVATMVIQIPAPVSGYVNLGDCVVLLCEKSKCIDNKRNFSTQVTTNKKFFIRKRRIFRLLF